MASETILVVDGDTRSRKILDVSFRKSGYRVVMTETVEEALGALGDADPDLIISDTDLPDGDGFEFCKEVKKRGKWESVPFLFLTEEASLPNKIKGLEIGADDYLTRPIYIKEVTTRVDVLLKKRDRELLSQGEVEEFEGELADITMIDLLQTIDEEDRSGEIEFERQGRHATVTFSDGRVVDAVCGKLRGAEAVYRLMLWPSGTFQVRYHEEVPKADHLDTPTDELLIEGIEHLEAWNREVDKLPSLDRVFDADYRQLPELLDRVPEEVGRVIRLFDGYRTLREVVDDSPVDDVTAVRIIRRIFDEGVLEDVTPSAEETAPGVGEASHLDDWLESTKQEGEERESASEPSPETPPQRSTSPGRPGGGETKGEREEPQGERQEEERDEEEEEEADETGAEDLADALTRELDRGLDEADEMESGPRYMPDEETKTAELATDRESGESEEADATLDELEEAERERRREEAKRLVEQKQDEDVAEPDSGEDAEPETTDDEGTGRRRDSTPRAHPSQGGPIPESPEDERDATREGPAVPVDMSGDSPDDWELEEQPDTDQSTGLGPEPSNEREEAKTLDEGLKEASGESLEEDSAGQGVPPSFQTVEGEGAESDEPVAAPESESDESEGASERRRPEAHERPASWTESGVDEGAAEQVRQEADEEPVEPAEREESEESDEEGDDVRTSAERRAVSVDEAESVQDEAAQAVREGAEEALEEADERARELDESDESSGTSVDETSARAEGEGPADGDEPLESGREAVESDEERGAVGEDLETPATEEELRSTEEFPELEDQEEFPDLDVGDAEEGPDEVEDDVERVSNNRELVRVEYDLAKEDGEMVEEASSRPVDDLVETTDTGLQESEEETMKARELLEGEEEELESPGDEPAEESGEAGGGVEDEPADEEAPDADSTLPGAGGSGLEWEDEPTARDMESWAEEHEEDESGEGEEPEREEREEGEGDEGDEEEAPVESEDAPAETESVPEEEDEPGEESEEGEQEEDEREEVEEEEPEEEEETGAVSDETVSEETAEEDEEEEADDGEVDIGFASGELPPEEREDEVATLGDSDDEQEFFEDADEAEYSWDIDDEHAEGTSNWQWWALATVFLSMLVAAWALGFGPFSGVNEKSGTPTAKADEPTSAGAESGGQEGAAGASSSDAESDGGETDTGTVDTGPSEEEIVAALETRAEEFAMSTYSVSQRVAANTEIESEESPQTGGSEQTGESEQADEQEATSGGRAAAEDEGGEPDDDQTGGTEATSGSSPSVQDQVERASDLLSQGRFAEAKRILDKASREAPNNDRIAQMYLQLGSKFQGSDSIGQAEASYRSYLQMKPDGQHAGEVESILDRPPFSE